MSVIAPPLVRPSSSQPRLLSEQTFVRTIGGPLVEDNSVRILRDSTENYPAWLEAIASARHKVYFENYIVGNDATGHQFVEALADRARAGVKVLAIYDWLGTRRGKRLFAPLIAAGGEVRCFNPPHLDSPFGWLTRDHRKSISVDGRVAFVTGLCVSQRWEGDPQRGVEPWRDTGVELRGPAVADVERAFAQVWRETGKALGDDELTDRLNIAPAGDVKLAVIATAPADAGVYRLDQIIATVARRTLWITDAYFVGLAPYVQALRGAALDDVDVRLLVPGSSDIQVLSPVTRAGYRSLLEAGVRIFEWNGPMMHAKTAVADCRWARVGSSNLNISSWLGNYELDVTADDVAFATQMEDMYQEDLTRATEIVLRGRNRVGPSRRVPRATPKIRGQAGSASRAAAGALRISNTVSAAIAKRRVLGPAEAGVMVPIGVLLVLLAAICVLWPELVAIPVGLLSCWVGLALLAQALRLRRAPVPSDERDDVVVAEEELGEPAPDAVAEREAETSRDEQP
jgi:cardiolipin synthase